MTQAGDFDRVHVVPMEKRPSGHRGLNGDIVMLNDGTLLMAYMQQGIVTRHSADVGRTWSEETMLFPNPPGQGRFAHPSFLQLEAEGQLLISYIYNAGTTPYFGQNYLRRSSDQGETWGDQFLLTPAPGYVIMHNDKLRRLADGRIIAPAEYKKHRPDAADHSDYAALVFYSDTQGYSWWPADNDIDVLPHEAQEPHVVELRDGRLLLFFRTYSGCVGRSFSTDRGQTWSAGELLWDLPMSRNASAITVDRMPSTGDLLLIRCTGEGGAENGFRTPLVSAISTDEGLTWTHERSIAEDRDDDYGYQSVTFVEEQGESLALVTYHARDGVHLGRIPLDWFYG